MNKKVLLAAILAVLMLVGCKKDPIDDIDVPGGKGNILLETTVKNADGITGTSYIQLIESINGSVDNSNGIQVGFASSVTVEDDEIFVFPSWGTDDNTNLVKYKYDAKKQVIGDKQELELPPNSGASHLIKVNDQKAYLPCYILGKVLVINPTAMEKIGEIDLSSYAHGDLSAEPSYGIIRDGYYYLPLNQLDATFMPYLDYFQSDVAIIDINTDKVVKVISEDVSNLAFPTRPLVKHMIFKTEQNDIYIACSGTFGFIPTLLNNGFICIPNGQTEFDISRSWDISETTIEGTEYKPSSVFSSRYLGNGKVAAYVAISELMGDNPYSSKYTMAVIIDLNEKTIKAIDGIPLTDGHSIWIEEHNGLAIFTCFGDSDAGVFTYNIATGEVQKTLSTAGNPIFVHFF